MALVRTLLQPSAFDKKSFPLVSAAIEKDIAIADEIFTQLIL